MQERLKSYTPNRVYASKGIRVKPRSRELRAFRFDGRNGREASNWAHGSLRQTTFWDRENRLMVPQGFSTEIASPGDWLVEIAPREFRVFSHARFVEMFDIDPEDAIRASESVAGSHE